MSSNTESAATARMTTLLTALLLTAPLVLAPVASAAKHPCRQTGLWTSVFTEDTWEHERCQNTMSVTRWGGKLGYCTKSYPVGRIYSGPEDDCGYYVNGGPI